MRPPEPNSPENINDIAVLYSGGSDSTLTAYKAAQRSPRVHLLTFRRFGMVHVERSETNIPRLRERCGPERFVRPPMASIDSLFRHVTYEHYLPDLLRHGFYTLTTCGSCKVAMHLAALVYCLDHGVRTVWDGANRHMVLFPAQMPGVIDRLRTLYASAGILYENPVFHYEDNQGLNFGSFLYGLGKRDAERLRDPTRRTTGRELYEAGILPDPEVKGTPYDKQIQGRCYQFVLFNLWARWYALERGDLETYQSRVLAYYQEKLDRMQRLVNEHLRNPQGSRLRRMLEEG